MSNNDDFVSGFVDEIACIPGQRGEFWKITINGESYGLGKFPPKFGEGSEVEFYIRWNGNYPNVDTDTLNIINAVGNGPSGGGNRGGGGGGRGGQGRGGQGQRQNYGGGNQVSGSRSQGGQGYGQRQQSNGGSGGYGGQRQGGRPGAGQGGTQRSSGGAGAGKDQYWADKEKRDVETQKAIQLQSSRNSAIALLGVLLSNGAVALPTTKGKAYDAALGLLDELTEKFQNETNDLLGRGGQRQQRGGQGHEPDGEPDGDDLPEYDPDQD